MVRQSAAHRLGRAEFAAAGAAMARWLPRDPESFVLELGPGTGAVTDALLKHGLREDRLIAIEHNPTLAKLLRKNFRAPTSSPATPGSWTRCWPNCRCRSNAVGAVISSLPLLNFPKEQADALAQKIRSVLEPRGRLVQYSYHIIKDRSRRRGRFPARRLQNRLVEPPAGPRPRFSEIIPRPALPPASGSI